MTDEKRIRERAHQLWEQEGRPEGADQKHWLQAERELAGEVSAGTASRKSSKSRRSSGAAAPKRKSTDGAEGANTGTPGSAEPDPGRQSTPSARKKAGAAPANPASTATKRNKPAC